MTHQKIGVMGNNSASVLKPGYSAEVTALSAVPAQNKSSLALTGHLSKSVYV